MKPYPIQGLLMSDEEHSAAVAQWLRERNAEDFAMLLNIAVEELGMPIPSPELAAAVPEANAMFWRSTTFAIARKHHPAFRRHVPGRRQSWDDSRLCELVADVWFERDATGESDIAICAALAGRDEYRKRWRGRAPQSLQTKFIAALKRPVVRLVLDKFRDADFRKDLRADFIRQFALYGASLETS